MLGQNNPLGFEEPMDPEGSDKLDDAGVYEVAVVAAGLAQLARRQRLM